MNRDSDDNDYDEDSDENESGDCDEDDESWNDEEVTDENMEENNGESFEDVPVQAKSINESKYILLLVLKEEWKMIPARNKRQCYNEVIQLIDEKRRTN